MRRAAGVILIEVYVGILIFGIIAAVLVKKYQPFSQATLAQCALAIDGAADSLAKGEEPKQRCSVKKKAPIAVTGAGDARRVCCPNPEKHGVKDPEKLCRGIDGPVLASAYPMPDARTLSIWTWGTRAFIVVAIVAFIGINASGGKRRGF